jgi:hypothetical protein
VGCEEDMHFVTILQTFRMKVPPTTSGSKSMVSKPMSRNKTSAYCLFFAVCLLGFLFLPEAGGKTLT